MNPKQHSGTHWSEVVAVLCAFFFVSAFRLPPSAFAAEADHDILCAAVYGECSGWTVDDEITAAVDVIKNRLADPRHRWGRTLQQVLEHKTARGKYEIQAMGGKQYRRWLAGSVPVRETARLRSLITQAWESTDDPTGGALYFCHGDVPPSFVKMALVPTGKFGRLTTFTERRTLDLSEFDRPDKGILDVIGEVAMAPVRFVGDVLKAVLG